MTTHKNLLILLNDIETFMDTRQSPEAERLIGNVRAAIAKDFGGEFNVSRDKRQPTDLSQSQ